MRTAQLFLMAVLCTIFLTACAGLHDDPDTGLENTPLGSDCPELEGYPDCVNGHHVSLATLLSPEAYANDRARIEDLQARFVHALDSADADALASCFTEDGVLDWMGHIESGRTEIRDAILAKRKNNGGDATDQPSTRTRRIVTNLTVRVNGNNATAQADWIELNEDRGHHLNIVNIGRYQDNLVERGQQWFIVKRTVLEDTSERAM